jgi:hypothetical protein
MQLHPQHWYRDSGIDLRLSTPMMQMIGRHENFRPLADSLDQTWQGTA